jgi:trehalose 2-sulfotransferase
MDNSANRSSTDGNVGHSGAANAIDRAVPTGQAGSFRALFGWMRPRRRRHDIVQPGPDWHPHFGHIAGTDVVRWLSGYPDRGPPQRSIVLATDERTGSEWLCALLGATGRLGRPSEYFNTPWMRRFIPDYPESVPAQIAIAHRVGTTANGCLSIKLHPWHLDRLLQGGTVSSAFPAPSFVRLLRRDLLAQALSLYRARQTGSFHSHIAEERRADFNADAIEQQVHELAVNRVRWDMYFARTGIVPLVLSYEELRANPLGVVRQIAARVGERVGRHDLADVRPTGQQADAVSAEWKERYIRERGSPDRFDPL